MSAEPHPVARARGAIRDARETMERILAFRRQMAEHRMRTALSERDDDRSRVEPSEPPPPRG